MLELLQGNKTQTFWEAALREPQNESLTADKAEQPTAGGGLKSKGHKGVGVP